MFQVIIEKLKYVKGVPIELTERAIMGGQLGKGQIVGIIGHCWERSDEPAFMEVRLTSNLHAGLIHPGQELNLHGQGDVFWIDPEQKPPKTPPTRTPQRRQNTSERIRPGPGSI